MKRKSDLKSSGLDRTQIAQLDRLFVVSRDYASKTRHGNTTCIAWHHFGFLSACDRSDYAATTTNINRRNTVNAATESTVTVAGPSDGGDAAKAASSVVDRIAEGQKIIDDTSYWCG